MANFNIGRSMMAAYQLVQHNRLRKKHSNEEHDAIKRLRECFTIEDWGPDLVIKAFRDLDTVFFNGRL